MPNQDNTNQNSNQNISSSVPFSPQADLPPLPPEFQNLTAPTVQESNSKTDSGSATPPVPEFSNITANPKKKFGTKKIIATILGVLALVGSIGAGTYLVGQKQLFQQKAASVRCNAALCPRCACGCHSGDDGNCNNGTYCNTGCPTATPNPVTGETCAYSCLTKVDGKCPAGTYSQTGTCNAVNSACCLVPSTNPSSNPTTRDWPPNGTQCQKSSWSGSPNSSIGGCIVYFCPNGCSGGCGEGDSGVYWKSGLSCSDAVGQLGSYCGQVDTIDTSGIYCVANPSKYKDSLIQCGSCTKPPGKTSPPTTKPSTSPSPTASPVAPYCAAIHVYDTDWNLISQSADTTNLSTLKPGDTIRFTVEGSPASGIDMAKFTVNARVGEVNQGALSGEITTKKPGTNEFYFEYTIPAGATSISVSGQVHHSTGWF